MKHQTQGTFWGQATKEQIVLGVDPGLHISGFGIGKKMGRTIQLIDYGYLKMNPSKHLCERVAMFYDFFLKKIEEHNVMAIALETPFLGKNTQSFLKLGYLRGILYLLAHQRATELHEFSPTQVKLSVTGFGGASKDQVAAMMIRLFPMLKSPEKFDVTDAIAVTLCGLQNSSSALNKMELLLRNK